jgi:hypothetical protein
VQAGEIMKMFDDDTLLAYGYPLETLEILSVENGSSQTKEQGAIAITVRHRQPKAGEFVTEALTYPYHMIRMPKLDASKVVFKHI